MPNVFPTANESNVTASKGGVGRITRGIGSNRPKIRLVSTGTKLPAGVMAAAIALKQNTAVNPKVRANMGMASETSAKYTQMKEAVGGGDPKVMAAKDVNPSGTKPHDHPPHFNEVGRNQGKFKGGTGTLPKGMTNSDPTVNNTAPAKKKPISADRLGLIKLKNDAVIDRRSVRSKLTDATNRRNGGE